jgi:SAM-dependent methyltransferase
MSFEVPADAYDRFMGQYAVPLAGQFAELAGVRAGQRALDVGCGPGAFTAELVQRLGHEAVAAVDPSDQFVAAMRQRFPDIDVRCAGAEDLPFADDSFDLSAAQLVVHFMTDPVAGLREMGRVTTAGGTVAACVWDQAGGTGPLAAFWRAVNDLDPGARDESRLPGVREGQLAELFGAAGLHDIESSSLSVTRPFATFAEWWDLFLLGVGPAGAYVAGLDGPRRGELEARCRRHLPPAPFVVTATAWCARARAA